MIGLLRVVLQHLNGEWVRVRPQMLLEVNVNGNMLMLGKRKWGEGRKKKLKIYIYDVSTSNGIIIIKVYLANDVSLDVQQSGLMISFSC